MNTLININSNDTFTVTVKWNDFDYNGWNAVDKDNIEFEHHTPVVQEPAQVSPKLINIDI